MRDKIIVLTSDSNNKMCARTTAPCTIVKKQVQIGYSM